VDKAHRLIRKWDATDASVHDSQKLDDVLDLCNTGTEVWADSAYRSAQIEAGLKAKGLQSRHTALGDFCLGRARITPVAPQLLLLPAVAGRRVATATAANYNGVRNTVPKT
jgi:Transposase DDE domain